MLAYTWSVIPLIFSHNVVSIGIYLSKLPLTYIWLAALLFANPLAGSIALEVNDVPFIFALVSVYIINSINNLLTYYIAGFTSELIGKIKKRVAKSHEDENAPEVNTDPIGTIPRTGRMRKIIQAHSSFVCTLNLKIAEKRKYIIFLIICIPFVPYLPTCASAALRLTNTGSSIIIIMLGGAIRIPAMLAAIYYFPKFLPIA